MAKQKVTDKTSAKSDQLKELVAQRMELTKQIEAKVAEIKGLESETCALREKHAGLCDAERQLAHEILCESPLSPAEVKVLRNGTGLIASSKAAQRLRKRGLVSIRTIVNKRYYVLTPQGREFLKKIEEGRG